MDYEKEIEISLKNIYEFLAETRKEYTIYNSDICKYIDTEIDCVITHDTEDETYNLHTIYGGYCASDGEKVTAVEIDPDYVRFVNRDEGISFKLSLDECKHGISDKELIETLETLEINKQEQQEYR